MSDGRLDSFDKTEWRDVVNEIDRKRGRPPMDDDEYNALWEDFQSRKVDGMFRNAIQ